MLWKILVLGLLASSYAADEKPEVNVEEGVLVLTTKNFDSVISDNEFVLVEFYAPWCGHCKKLAPEYAKAAQTLAAAESPVKLGKVDATVERDLGSKYGVRGYPTLKFFRNGAALEYGGGRTEESIVKWVQKKSGPPAVTITTKEDADKLLENQVAVVGFFKDVESDDAKAFLKVAGENDDYQFSISSDEAVMKELEIEKEGVTIFKKFDEKRADLTEGLSVDSIKEFVESKAVPLLVEFTQENSQKLFSNPKTPFMFLIMSKKSDDYEKVAEAFTKVSDENRGKLRSVFLNTEDKMASNVINYLNVKEEEYPTYRVLNLEKGLKYKPEEADMSFEKVSEFVNKFVSGDIKPYLKSEEVPEDWDANHVKVLVGKNFKEVALDDSKHVFVEFYAPWCGHCKKLAPIWDELAEKYAGSEEVVIAKMDSTQNEIEEVSIKGFPTLKLFPAKSDGKIVDYKGDRSLDDLVKFVSEYSKPPTKEEKKPEEEEKKEEGAPDTPEEVPEEKEKKKDEL